MNFRQEAFERALAKVLVGQPKPKPFCRVINGRLITGTDTLHRTPQSRRWRKLIWIRTRLLDI